jgi:hypothetical protein
MTASMTYAPRRTTRGNALTADTRKYLIDFLCFEDDWSKETWSRSEQYAEANRLGRLNNAQFRSEFINRYGKEWWDDMLSRH